MDPENNHGPQVPYLTEEEIRQKAAGFLAAAHPTGTIPIPIELIVEKRGQDIVPLPGLHQNYQVDGCTSTDGSTVFVDQWMSQHRENRYRFTLAHELGHAVLHCGIFAEQEVGPQDLESWIELRDAVDESTWRRFEWQANVFAGHVLVPRDALREEFSRVLWEIKPLVSTAISRGARKEAATGPAWDKLVSQIAIHFQVSDEVIRRRLDKDGHNPSSL